MRIIETRAQLGITGNKPLHKTGEVEESRYFKRLHQSERSHLQRILSHLHIIAASEGISLHVLAVGSSADLQSPYNDIDLLICPDEGHVRFYSQARMQLQSDRGLRVLPGTSIGSAPIVNDPLICAKLLILPNPLGLKPTQIDMAFLGDHGGSFAETLLLHRQNDLALCQLENTSGFI